MDEAIVNLEYIAVRGLSRGTMRVYQINLKKINYNKQWREMKGSYNLLLNIL